MGYYDSKTDRQDYLVSNNTVKYSVISKKDGIAIYSEYKPETLARFKQKYNLNIVDTYARDRQNYINTKKESMISSIIFAGIILAISLIEIYLMIRSSFLSRIKEIGVLRAIGVKKSDIYRMFLGEIFAITTIASIPGIILMTAILKSLIPIPYVGNMYVVNSLVVGFSIMIVYIFNSIVGLLPLFRVLRKKPAQILARHDIE